MCGVLGMFTNNFKQSDKLQLQKLIFQSKIRGLHSFGCSYKDDSGILNTFKTHNMAELLNCVESIRGANLKIIIHNRYSTSGDFKNHLNNQPVVEGGSALVFNGVISMKTKQENEKKYGLKLSTDNDGEIILKKILNKEEFLLFIQQKGSCAGLFLGETFFAFRNFRRPLYKAATENALFYFSTKDIAERAGFESDTIIESLEYELISK